MTTTKNVSISTTCSIICQAALVDLRPGPLYFISFEGNVKVLNQLVSKVRQGKVLHNPCRPQTLSFIRPFLSRQLLVSPLLRIVDVVVVISTSSA